MWRYILRPKRKWQAHLELQLSPRDIIIINRWKEMILRFGRKKCPPIIEPGTEPLILSDPWRGDVIALWLFAGINLNEWMNRHSVFASVSLYTHTESHTYQITTTQYLYICLFFLQCRPPSFSDTGYVAGCVWAAWTRVKSMRKVSSRDRDRPDKWW